ncbi:c-type cytochrome [Bradyrhizobium sp. HKCCYLRH3061]|uniref:c-type cytochrome n=1 Tax=Bradyrhizobium sp. HKCCYLRH3061 TaxID=3420734 RepID=UPI003EC0DC63
MRTLAAIGVLAICLATAGAIYFFGGFYDVAAAGGGNSVVAWAVANVREASLNQHVEAPATPAWFDDSKTVAAGAHEFAEEGCARCHGAPGRKPDKFAQGMEPRPPDLGDVTADDSPGYIYWVVKNGIRMTGMPAFRSHADDDEIWRAVAFVKHMKQVDANQFKQWSVDGESRAGEAAVAAPGSMPAEERETERR